MHFNEKKTWKDGFRITEEEEINFDQKHSEPIDRYINVYNYRESSYPTVNTNRLNTDNYYTR